MAESPASEETARLLQGLGHEVGNALAAIRLSSHLAHADGTAAPEGTAAAIDAQCARAGAWLALIRPLAEPGDDDERSNLGAEEILAGIAHAVAEPDGRLRVAPCTGDLPAIRADSDALHHLLLVLVLGALERTGPAGIVGVAADTEPAGLCIRVEDEGSESPAILELQIARAVVARDGADLTVEPRTDGRSGTRVALRIPAVGC